MELRLYSFVNFYLSSIQQGIQTGHAAVRIARLGHSMADEWADNHETFIILNGGDSDGVNAAYDIISATAFPFSDFRESAQSLDGLRTCVAVVLPETIFNARYDKTLSIIKSADCYIYTSPDSAPEMYQESYIPGNANYELVKLLRSSRLAS